MQKQINQSFKITEDEQYIDYVQRPDGWKCGLRVNPPLNKIALRNRERRLKKEQEEKLKEKDNNNG